MPISFIQQRGQVTFPEFTGERVYMRRFTKKAGLPCDLARWQKTVDQMLEGVDTEQSIYIMIDQAPVRAGQRHRRAGLHLDGYWSPELQKHGGGHLTSSWDTGSGRWKNCDFSAPEALILASNFTAARGFHGTWMGDCAEGGDCSHIDTSSMKEVSMRAGNIYAGNVTMLHESLPVSCDVHRTLVRLSVPGWTPERATQAAKGDING